MSWTEFYVRDRSSRVYQTSFFDPMTFAVIALRSYNIIFLIYYCIYRIFAFTNQQSNF